MAADPLYVADRDTPSFRASRKSIDVVCAGDSITGWNNFGCVSYWPYRTYPEFLQRKCGRLGLRIANGGIAGEISENGEGQVRDYHNEQLRGYCGQSQVPLVDICSHLRDEHFADELHPSGKGAEVIAEQVFRVLFGMLEEHHGEPGR